jgi:prevent-host-death family protein
MKRASITDAKNRLSALIDRVRNGETILIEDRGLPVAQLTPVAGRTDTSDGDRFARLERQGILRPAVSRKPGRLLDAPPPAGERRVALSKLVRAEREEGR